MKRSKFIDLALQVGFYVVLALIGACIVLALVLAAGCAGGGPVAMQVTPGTIRSVTLPMTRVRAMQALDPVDPSAGPAAALTATYTDYGLVLTAYNTNATMVTLQTSTNAVDWRDLTTSVWGILRADKVNIESFVVPVGMMHNYFRLLMFEGRPVTNLVNVL